MKAQILNADFENWSAGEPGNWYTLNFAFPGLVTQTSDYYSGASAARLNTIYSGGYYYGGSLISGSTPGLPYFPVSTTPLALHGWYKFNSTSTTESVNILSDAKYNGSVLGFGVTAIQTNTLVYTEFICDFYYSGSTTVDSAEIYITMSSTDSLRIGTYFTLDDLSFGLPSTATSIRELSKTNMLEPCSPNPAALTTNIIYRINSNSDVNLAIYDLVGNKIKTLLDMDQLPGRYKIPVDLSDFSSGLYFYRLNVNGKSFTQKLIVVK